jgi:hypothetical protein
MVNVGPLPVVRMHKDFSFKGAAVVEGVDVILTPAFEF